MRTIWTWALAFTIPAVCVTAARPAEKAAALAAPEGATVQLILLRQKSVRQDLKLPKDATQKIFEFTHKQWQAAQEALKQGQAERKQKFQELRKENEQFLKENLTAQQRKRLDQITLQVVGLMWMNRPAIAKGLKLTEEQKQKIRQLRMDSRKELEEAINAKDRKERHEKLAALRKDTHQKLHNLLTDEQRTKWKELVGAPFKGEIMYEEPEQGGSKK